MTRRDPNAPNPYYLLAKLREEEMAERARLACPHVPRRAAAHERPTCCPAYSEHERCATDLVCRLKVSLQNDTTCTALRARCERVP